MSFSFPRCQVLPEADHQASFVIDGVSRLRWHFGPQYPRPFLYPLVGPGGSSLSRMGHPGAPDHDHHRSVWFAHHKVLGIDFWSDRTEARIRQKQWLDYLDGPAEAVMAVLLGWYDGHDPRELVEQELVVAVRPLEARGELAIELQSTFRPTAERLEFGQTNFGFLAVRVAKNLSAHFGGGQICNSAGQVGEPALFGQPAAWVDYSGPVPSGGVEGITYFDHPRNPGHPARWHVREDGWMGASACFSGPLLTEKNQPLALRYLLHVHSNEPEPARAQALFDQFAALPPYRVAKSTAKHRKHEIVRG